VTSTEDPLRKEVFWRALFRDHNRKLLPAEKKNKKRTFKPGVSTGAEGGGGKVAVSGFASPGINRREPMRSESKKEGEPQSLKKARLIPKNRA